MPNDIYDSTKAAFLEMRSALPNGGADLIFNGVTQKVIAGSVTKMRVQRESQSDIEFGTPADLLNEEFAGFGAIVINETEGTFNGLPVFVVSIESDTEDPITHLVLRVAH